MKHFIFFFSKLKISHIIRLGRSQAKGKMKQLKPFKPTVSHGLDIRAEKLFLAKMNQNDLKNHSGA